MTINSSKSLAALAILTSDHIILTNLPTDPSSTLSLVMHLNIKGYLCLASSGKIYISRDVIFDESFFSYQLSSSSPPSTSTTAPQIVPAILLTLSQPYVQNVPNVFLPT